MLWSANPSTEAIWRSTGVSGQLTADSLDADVINQGGNKLDQYLTVHSTLQLVTHGDQTAGTLTLTRAKQATVANWRRPVKLDGPAKAAAVEAALAKPPSPKPK